MRLLPSLPRHAGDAVPITGPLWAPTGLTACVKTQNLAEQTPKGNSTPACDPIGGSAQLPKVFCGCPSKGT